MFLKPKFSVLLLFFIGNLVLNAQSFKTDKGSLEAIAGVKRYNVIFEYSDDLKIPGYASEKYFIEHYAKKMDRKVIGYGDIFKEQWFSNRANAFEPKFIQEFNLFNLKEKKITAATNISDSAYTMVVRTTLIDPGGSNFFFKKDAWLKVFITIYKTDSPETILYATEAVEVHSKGANSDIFDRIMSAYAELGRGLSKHLSRKT